MKNIVKLTAKAFFLTVLAAICTIIACWVLRTWGLKVLLLAGVVFAGFAFVWLAWWLNDKGKLTTSVLVVFVLVYIGFVMAGFTYYLAYIGSDDIAESLSKVVIADLVVSPAVLLLKALTENLSKNNTWPDKTTDKKSSGSQPKI